MTEYKIALVGFGGVNRSLAKLIAEKNQSWNDELGFSLKIVGITDTYLGSIQNRDGLNAQAVANLPATKGAFAQLEGGSEHADNEHVIKETGADIIAEATFTNPKDGEPASTFCRWALENGKHVVTTNKGPIAIHGSSLKKLAAENGVFFEYEGSVMSGTPVIRFVKETLAGAELQGFEGILNGTSNYILTQMENGENYQAALTKAQENGYAEADPTADVDGFDVRLKVVILANELLNADLSVDDVSCAGIRQISTTDIEKARNENKRWKLIGSAFKGKDGKITASVEPRLLDNVHPLAGISGATNAVSLNTEMLGAATVSGPGAGRIETAYALLSDIISIHKANAQTF